MAFATMIRESGRPLVGVLELTHRCSFLCSHCYIPEVLRRGRAPHQLGQGRAPGLTTKELQRVMNELAELGSLFLTLTGGEIFLRPDLDQLLAHAVKRKFCLRLFTNGFHVDRTWVERLQRYGIYALEVSVYGFDNRTYEKTTGVKQGWEKVKRSVEMLRQAGLRVVVKTPVLKPYVQQIPAMKEWAESLGATFRFDPVIIPRFNGDRQPLELACDDEELRTLYTTLLDGRDAEAEASGPNECAVGKWTLLVSPEGEVYPCVELRRSIGNVRTSSLHDIWKENRLLREIREELDAFRANPGEAFADGMCQHCAGQSYNTTGSMTQASPEYVRDTQVRRHVYGKLESTGG